MWKLIVEGDELLRKELGRRFGGHPVTPERVQGAPDELDDFRLQRDGLRVRDAEVVADGRVGLPSEADAAAARLERVFFRRLRRAILLCGSILAFGTFLLMLWDAPQRDVLISALLFVGFAIMVPLARTLAKDLEIPGAPILKEDR